MSPHPYRISAAPEAILPRKRSFRSFLVHNSAIWRLNWRKLPGFARVFYYPPDSWVWVVHMWCLSTSDYLYHEFF